MKGREEVVKKWDLQIDTQTASLKGMENIKRNP